MTNITDPRDRNKYFNTSTAFDYLTGYIDEVYSAVRTISAPELSRATELLKSRRVFVGGNGGSSAISDHLACDFEKSAHRPVVNLSSRPALLSAIANDYGYEHTLSWQLCAAKVDAWDTVILISSSGNSPNILEAAKYAKTQGAKILGLTGFDGGALKRLCDVSLHINVNNYGVVEDSHQALMHILAQFHWLKHGA